MIPADIREVVERAKLFALADSMDGETILISKDDLMFASNGVRQQVLMSRPKETRIPDGFKPEVVFKHDAVEKEIEAAESFLATVSGD